MITVTHYGVAVLLCVITMICWGSWANTQKLASREWRFQLFYWDYAFGVLLLALVLAFTAGSTGEEGRGFLSDLRQADAGWLWSAFFGGVVFNLSNILLVAAIDIAGMAVAFPIGVGLALALGVITTYLARPEGNGLALAAGVTAIVVAVVLDALAYRKLATHRRRTPTKGIALSIAAGVLMGFFYSFVARAIAETAPVSGGDGLEAGKLTPYTALVLFSVGLVASNFVWNTAMMLRPFSGSPVSFRDYFKGTLRLHLIGILGGAIWNLGLGLSLVANHAAGPALSYGLGQGATMIGALWGVFVWREFRDGPPGTRGLLTAMFCFYLLGLGILVASKL